jgi:DnaJ-class molecular chaperone
MEQGLRKKEDCLICEGKGRREDASPCAYCGGAGFVHARLQGSEAVLMATGDCKVPAKRKSLEGLKVVRALSGEGH